MNSCPDSRSQKNCLYIIYIPLFSEQAQSGRRCALYFFLKSFRFFGSSCSVWLFHHLTSFSCLRKFLSKTYMLRWLKTTKLMTSLRSTRKLFFLKTYILIVNILTFLPSCVVFIYISLSHYDSAKKVNNKVSL